MNITTLAAQRAKYLALVEELAGWDSSPLEVERRLFAEAKANYRRAEKEFSRAVSMYTAEELRNLGVAA